MPAKIYLQRCENFLANGVYEGSSEFSERVKWGDQFVLNNDIIDAQHHQLVDSSIELIEAIETDKSEDFIKKLITNFEKLAVTHFRTEESIIKEIDYPLFDYHKQQHELFLSYFSSIVEEITEPSLSKIFRMFKVQVFLIDWLVNHTQKEDKNFKKYLDMTD